jgi:hypothetical protein
MCTRFAAVVSLIAGIVSIGSGCAHAPLRPAPTELKGEATAGAEAAPPAEAAARAAMIVVTAEATVEVDEVAGFLRLAREQAGALGGSVASESLSGAGSRASATMQLRLPPARVDAFFTWLAHAARVESRRIEANDVSRQFFDEALAIENLRLTARRLQALLDRGGSLQDVLQIERELTRVRGELERLEGAHRSLGDQAARATIELRVGGAQDPATAAEKLFLVPAATLLGFVDARGRQGARAGGALGLMIVPQVSAELQLFPQHGAEERAWLMTLAAGTYSDLLGGGRRRWWNPHLGLVVGFGNVGGHGGSVIGASAGVEIHRSRYLLIDLQGRAQALFYGKDEDTRNDIALQGSLAVGVPF